MKATHTPKILILGEYDPAKETHQVTDRALVHSSAALGLKPKITWLDTDRIDRKTLGKADGILVAPGSPYRSMERVLSAIRFAREEGIPCLGTCGGFQHIMIEYARNDLGLAEAGHAEYDPCASTLFITELACSLRGLDMKLTLVEDSRVARLYGATSATERYYCNFGINPEFVDAIRNGPIDVVGSDDEGEIRVVEYPDHPFFVGTLFVPQARSTPEVPHPLVTGFVQAAADRT